MQQKPREQQVYESIKYAILPGEYNKGDVLHRYCFATHFKMNRTPICQELSRLAREGYVTSYGKSGRYVLCEGLIFFNVRKENEWT